MAKRREDVEVRFDRAKTQLFFVAYRGGDPAFYAFDLLWLNGRALRSLPLAERKQTLRGLIRRRKRTRIMYAQHVDADGCKLFKAICRMGLEGIVAKRRDGLYSLSTKWIKIKNSNYTHAEDRHELLEQRRSFRLKPLDGGQPEGTGSANPT